MPGPHFTDIHCHPEIKTFLSADIEQNRTDCWQQIHLTQLLELIDRVLLGNILGSQSSLSQVNNVRGTIALAGMYAMEKAMVNGDLFNLLGFKVNLREVARRLKQTNHNTIIDPDLLDRISLPQTSYFTMFLEDQSHLLNSQLINTRFKLMDKIQDYDPAMLNIVRTIEGGHNLYDQAAGSTQNGNMLQNLETLKLSGKRYLFMSLAHVERNPLCSHAYAMKFLQHDDFMPGGHGITPLGKQIIEKALKQPNRILIDIKHMSLEARKQYYRILERNYPSQDIPIVISHCGVTGVSWNEKPVVCTKKYRNWIKVRYFKPKGLKRTKFNPWSINIYDEEIRKIVDSNGLIGLNLDQRILGAKQKRPSERVEYFSPEEFNDRDFRLQLLKSVCSWGWDDLLPDEDRQSHSIRIRLLRCLMIIILNPNGITDFSSVNSEINDLYNQLRQRPFSPRGIKHLCNNILHIVTVAGDEAWKHISIGSDFDGLISPVQFCTDASQYTLLEQELKSRLPGMARAINGFQGISDVDRKVEGIMSGNAYRFLQRYFT